MNTIADIIRQRNKLKAKMEESTKKYESFMVQCKNQLAELDANENLLSHSVDIDKYSTGKSIMNVRFPSLRDYYSGEVRYSLPNVSLINDAKNDLINGAVKLKTQYFGQKYYSGFDQRSDHRYGYGPSHGSIYQSIGLRHPETVILTDSDIECCLYYLNNLQFEVDELNNK